MNAPDSIARALAGAFLTGEWEEDQLVARGSRLLGRRWRWLRPLARRVIGAFAGGTPPRQRRVARFIEADEGYRRAWQRHDVRVANLLANPPTMRRPADAAGNIRPLSTLSELAEWLEVSSAELDWFADQRHFERRRSSGRLRHYRYRLLAKRLGRPRLIEAPKPRLKRIQRRIANEILEPILPHSAAHGFRRGRSIATFAEPHAGRPMVVKIDLQDFFPSIALARVQALFRTVGYPESVADALAGLCTNSAPDDIWPAERCVPEGCGADAAALGRLCSLYARPHLPQGAPTSPALANLCAYRLDCRLAALAHSAGALYTRYADDLAFSGDREFERVAGRFHLHACAVALDEGFAVHHRKTRLMRQGVRQRLAGLVVNAGLSVPRDEFDRLKATLTNCIRFGPESQNRSGQRDFRRHLEGRIAFVAMVQPGRGGRLRSLFEQIRW